MLVSCRCAEASTCEAGSASDGVLAKLRCVRANLHEHWGEPAAECSKLLHPGVLHVRGQGSIVCNLWSLSCMQLLFANLSKPLAAPCMNARCCRADNYGRNVESAGHVSDMVAASPHAAVLVSGTCNCNAGWMGIRDWPHLGNALILL